MTKVGYTLDEFGGNFDALLIKGRPDALSDEVAALEGAALVAVFDLDWSHLGQAVLRDYTAAAEETSRILQTRVIHLSFQDAAGWLGYRVYDDGQVVEDYSFGASYDDEMIEAGVDPSAMRPAGTIAVTNDDGEQFLFRSSIRSLTEADIGGGDAFIDAFFKEQQTYLGWDLYG